MGGVFSGGPSEAPVRHQRLINEDIEDEDDDEVKMRGGAQKSDVGGATAGAATGTAAGLSTGATAGMILLSIVLGVFAVIGFIGAVMLWSQWSALMDLEGECNVNAVDKYTITRQFPDVTNPGWPTWSRDRQSSRYNPHISADTSQIMSIRGACAGGLNSFNVSTDVGISTTNTISYELGLIFSVTWGYQNGTGSLVLAYDPNCTIVWQHLASDYASQTGVGGNDGNVGVTNPYTTVRTSPTIVTNRTGGINLIFGDLGTTKLYNNSWCTNNVTTCGARVYLVEALTGTLLARTLVTEGADAYNNYNRQSDIITSSPQINADSAYFGMSSSQSGDVVRTGIINFYGRYFEIDINNLAILNIVRTTSDAQIAAGNFGSSVWDSSPPIDIKGKQIFFGTSNNYNYSESVIACLLAGHSRLYCAEDGINDDSFMAVSTVNFERKWINSPLGVDAWQTACVLPYPLNVTCPQEHGPDYDFGTGCTVVENECGQRYVVCLEKSGVLWSWEVDTGALKWRRYVGPGSYLVPNWGPSYDGENIYISIGNKNNVNFLMKDGTLRCDGFWAAVNAFTGKLAWTTAVPCSRSSADCIALNNGTIAADPFLLDTIPLADLLYLDRYPIKEGPALTCYGDPADDFRNDVLAGAASASGGIITTHNFMFAGDYTGHMNIFDKRNGHIIKKLTRCDQGIIYGSASIGIIQSTGQQILTYGCGYGRVDFGFPLAAKGNQIMTFTIPSN
jgi:hypothetical protein